MEGLYETKTSYREIAKDWKEDAIDFTYTWKFWWIYTLFCGLQAAVGLTVLAEHDPIVPPEIVAALAVFGAYQTHRHWGVHHV